MIYLYDQFFSIPKRFNAAHATKIRNTRLDHGTPEPESFLFMVKTLQD